MVDQHKNKPCLSLFYSYPTLLLSPGWRVFAQEAQKRWHGRDSITTWLCLLSLLPKISRICHFLLLRLDLKLTSCVSGATGEKIEKIHIWLMSQSKTLPQSCILTLGKCPWFHITLKSNFTITISLLNNPFAATLCPLDHWFPNPGLPFPFWLQCVYLPSPG